MLLLPAGKVLTGNGATPVELSVTEPKAVVPLLNVTFPVGTNGSPVTVSVTVAVSVIDCPGVDGLADETSATETTPSALPTD